MIINAYNHGNKPIKPHNAIKQVIQLIKQATRQMTPCFIEQSLYTTGELDDTIWSTGADSSLHGGDAIALTHSLG